MAKGLPYFKFAVATWLTGDIVYEPFAVQGLFINICSVYWQREGVLTVDDINKRYKNPKELKSLIDRFLIVNDGNISIQFLDKQLTERQALSKKNSANGKLGAYIKSTSAKRTPDDTTTVFSQVEEEEKRRELEERKNLNYIISVGKDKFNKKVSLVLLEDFTSLFETCMMTNHTGKPKEFILKEMDRLYPMYDFNDQNHLLKALQGAGKGIVLSTIKKSKEIK